MFIYRASIAPMSTGLNNQMQQQPALNMNMTGISPSQSINNVDNNPLRSHFQSQIPEPKPVTAQKTGSNNPFASVVNNSNSLPSQAPSFDNKGPTLNTIAASAFNQSMQNNSLQQPFNQSNLSQNGNVDDQFNNTNKKFQPTSSFGTNLEKQFGQPNISSSLSPQFTGVQQQFTGNPFRGSMMNNGPN